MATKAKENQVKLLAEKLTKAGNVIITDHTGINVNDLTGLRRDLRKSKAEMRVAKNTLLRLAADNSGLQDIKKHLIGPTSMVFGFDDPSVPARIIYEFQKKNKVPEVKGFILEGKLLDEADFKKIAQLPPREIVLAILIGAMNGSVTKFVLTINGVIRNFIGLVEALAEARK